MEAITSRTAQQEAELASKKQELAELEKQQEGGVFKKYLPWMIGRGVILVLVVGIIIYFLTRDKSKKTKIDL